MGAGKVAAYEHVLGQPFSVWIPNSAKILELFSGGGGGVIMENSRRVLGA